MGDTPEKRTLQPWPMPCTYGILVGSTGECMRNPESSWPSVVAIVGPTAVGKTRLALDLAHRLGAAIISADSRQIYRYLDIGTDKPSVTERGDVPHYLLDVVQPSELYSARCFQEEATRVLQRLALEGRPAFVVGGTGFYVRALLDREQYPAVPPHPELRQDLRQTASALGSAAVHQRLAILDPRSAERIHPNNLSRVIRAIEIIEATGTAIAPAERSDAIPALYLGLRRDRAELVQAADRRVDNQLQLGLVQETRALLAMGYGAEAPGLQGFGYREMVSFLRGDMTLNEAIERYKHATHAYIRRQFTWFRAENRIEWMDMGPDTVSLAHDRIVAWLNRRREARIDSGV